MPRLASFSNNTEWLTLSNALLASKNPANTHPFAEVYKLTISLRVYIQRSVPCFLLKPNWLAVFVK